MIDNVFLTMAPKDVNIIYYHAQWLIQKLQILTVQIHVSQSVSKN